MGASMEGAHSSGRSQDLQQCCLKGRRYYLLPMNLAFGTWVARLIAAPLNQRATTSEWTALNDFEELEMKRYVILPFPHSSEALWGPQREGRHLASALPKNQRFSGAPRICAPHLSRARWGSGEGDTLYNI